MTRRTDTPPDVSPVAPEHILELFPAGIIALDGEQRPVYVNSNARALLGASPENLVENETVAKALKAAAEDHIERRLVVFVARDDKGPVELGVSVVPAADREDMELGALLVFRLLEDGRSLDHRMREIEQLAAIGRLGAGFAHEVLNPVAAVRGLTEGFLDELPLDDPLAEYGQRILGLVERIERLVRSCVDLGREPVATPSSVSASDLVSKALRRLSRAEGVEVVVEGEVANVMADAHQIVECLRALLINALEAVESLESDDPTPIEVRVRPAAGSPPRVELEVRDCGPGIPAHLLSRVFEPFFTTKPHATGLGLSVARLVAAKNRGSLEVHSRSGETCFTLVLPAAEREDVA